MLAEMENISTMEFVKDMEKTGGNLFVIVIFDNTNKNSDGNVKIWYDDFDERFYFKTELFHGKMLCRTTGTISKSRIVEMFSNLANNKNLRLMVKLGYEPR